jgi:DNA-binding LacI/PurR family transcriptional regulator
MFTPRLVKPPTSSDVAQAAGVSRATVSFVLNDKPNSRISDDTRRRVRDAARLLGYTPNATARTLVINAVSGWLVSPPRVSLGTAIARTVDAIVDGQVQDGTEVIRDAGSFSFGADAAAAWSRYRPAAVLASSDRCDAAATEVLRLAGVRALMVYGMEAVEHAPSLVIPQRDYGRVAAEHLLDLGHRELAYVLAAGADTDDIVAARAAGARSATAGKGARLAIVRASPTSDALRDWAHGWRYARNRPTGIMAHDDGFAAAIVRALADAGVRCPEDVAVIGADDDPLSAEYCPRLSTVAFDTELLASTVTDAFARMLAGERIERVTAPAMRVLPRESTASST